MKSLSLWVLPASLLSITIQGINPSPSQAQLTVTQQRLVDAISLEIVEQVEQSSCDDFYLLLERRDDREFQNPQLRERLRQAAQNNPQIREEFVQQISAPVINKMFDCGLFL